MFGTGTWSAYLQRRGGTPVVLPIALDRASFGRPLDGTGQANFAVPVTAVSGTACCELLDEAEPWRDEIVLYRDSGTDVDMAFVGPFITGKAGGNGGSLFAQDLFFWMQRRFLTEDLFFDGDLSIIFQGIFDAAMAPDTSPNINMVIHNSGVEGVRRINGVDNIPAANPLGELARTALDYCTIGRTIYAGGAEVFTAPSAPATALLLHDGGVISAEVTKDGSQLATDVSVYGGAVQDGPIITVTHGRATRDVSIYGLVQQTFTELTIEDTPSADANALTRLESMLPTPRRLTAVLSPYAGFEFKDLIPGRRVDVRLSQAAGCGEIDQVMRLVNVSCDVGFDGGGVAENISLELIPLGTEEATT